MTEKRYPNGLRYDTDVRVRWSDLDAYGHVNNANTLTLLEEARVDWLFVDAVDHGVDKLMDGIVVARVALDYRRSIGYGAVVTASMFITEMGAASFTVGYDVESDGKLAVTATSLLVPVDLVTFRPRRLTEMERDYLARFLPES